MATVSGPDLPTMLRQHVQGLHHLEAAVDLLIAHDRWLRRGEFLAACVIHDRHFLDDHPIAYIDWDLVVGFLAETSASSSETRMLLIAAELADVATGWTISELLSGLDDTNTRLVLDAVAHHNGLHERGGR